MKYVSIDIETLGLHSECCDVIEFGAVIDDLESKPPLKTLPTFHCYVLPPKRYCGGKYTKYYQGEPFAMAMHADKLKRIADLERGYDYFEQHYVGKAFGDWLAENGIERNGPAFTDHVSSVEVDCEPVKIVVAGKNFSNFDAKFLDKLEDWNFCIEYHHRMFDPCTLYFQPGKDQKPPGLEDCLKRAGFDKKVNHNAVDDALDVIRCLRVKWGIPV